MNYYDMNKTLCKELCCEFEKFEKDPKTEYMHNIHKLVETMVGLTELEAAGAMRDYLEDEYGYNSRTGEFRSMNAYNPYTVWNAARRSPIANTRGMNPTYTGLPYGNEYDTRYDDGRSMTRNDGMDVYDRARSRDSRGRFNDGRDRYGIYNMAHMDGVKKKEKLTPQEIQKWMEHLESENGERGPMWTKEEIEAVAKKEGIQFDKFSKEALYAMTNVMYSDHCSTGEKYNVDSPSFYMALAVDFLTDPDAVGDGDDGDKKMAIYYENIAEH